MGSFSVDKEKNIHRLKSHYCNTSFSLLCFRTNIILSIGMCNEP